MEGTKITEELIERCRTADDSLHNKTCEECNCSEEECLDWLLEFIKLSKGTWERMENAYGELEGFMCRCGSQSQMASNYCPHCGRKMSGGEKTR
jgi:hypothetical protein